MSAKAKRRFRVGVAIGAIGLATVGLYHVLALPHGLNGPEFDQYLALLDEMRVALATTPPTDAAERAVWARYQRIGEDARRFAAALEEDPVAAEAFAHAPPSRSVNVRRSRRGSAGPETHRAQRLQRVSGRLAWRVAPGR